MIHVTIPNINAAGPITEKAVAISDSVLRLRHYESCILCEHRCQVNRLAGERGVCKATHQARVYKHRVEYGEEKELLPCHLFYLSGCDLRCAFCIAELNAFDPSRGDILTSEFLQTAVEWGKAQGARTLQWVGGEPTIHTPAILDVMSRCTELLPIVWKSDFYGTPEVFSLLQGSVDVFVADFKFGNDACAKRIAHVDNYFATVTRNFQIARKQADLIVRHLLLPGHQDCCYRPIVQYLQENLPEVKFSLREGFLPSWQARHYDELSQTLPLGLGLAARSIAREAGLHLIT